MRRAWLALVAVSLGALALALVALRSSQDGARPIGASDGALPGFTEARPIPEAPLPPEPGEEGRSALGRPPRPGWSVREVLVVGEGGSPVPEATVAVFERSLSEAGGRGAGIGLRTRGRRQQR